MTLNGKPPASDPTECAKESAAFSTKASQLKVRLVDDSGAEFSTVLPCDQSDGRFALSAPVGAYRVLLSEGDAPPSGFPFQSTMILASSFKVRGATKGVTWNATTCLLSGSLTLNGKPPPAIEDKLCMLEMVELHFTNELGAEFSTSIPCEAKDGGFSLLLAPGRYRVVATEGRDHTHAAFAVSTEFEVSDRTPRVNWNLTTIPVRGTFAVNGKAPVADPETLRGDRRSRLPQHKDNAGQPDVPRRGRLRVPHADPVRHIKSNTFQSM